jgi:hypothetical protein
MQREDDRNEVEDVGLNDFGPKPRVWQFYSRKKAKGIINKCQ